MSAAIIEHVINTITEQLRDTEAELSRYIGNSNDLLDEIAQKREQVSLYEAHFRELKAAKVVSLREVLSMKISVMRAKNDLLMDQNRLAALEGILSETREKLTELTDRLKSAKLKLTEYGHIYEFTRDN